MTLYISPYDNNSTNIYNFLRIRNIPGNMVSFVYHDLIVLNHRFIRLINVSDCLLCAKCCARCWCAVVSTTELAPNFMQLL